MLYHYNLDMFLIYTHILQVWHTLREHVGKLLGGRGGGGVCDQTGLEFKSFHVYFGTGVSLFFPINTLLQTLSLVGQIIRAFLLYLNNTPYFL